MGMISRKGFPVGWAPDADKTDAPPGTLLRMDNLVLDDREILTLRKGSTLLDTLVEALIMYPDADTALFDDVSMPCTLVGAASRAAAMADRLDTSYVRMSGKDTTVATGDATTDQNVGPGITGTFVDGIVPPSAGLPHKVKIRARRTIVTDVDITQTDVIFSLRQGFVTIRDITVSKANLDAGAGEWVDLEYTLTSPEVAAIVLAGYNNIKWRIDASWHTEQVTGFSEAIVLDISRFVIEIG